MYILALLSFESSAFIYSVAGIATILQNYYHLHSAWEENIPLFLFPLVFLLFSPFVVPLTRKLGLKTIFGLSLLIFEGACLFGCFVKQGFGFLLVSSLLGSLVPPLIQCQYTTIAMTYVDKNIMSFYLGLLTFFGSAGNAFGFLLTSFVIVSPRTFEYYFPRIQILFLLMNSLCLLLLLPTCKCKHLEDHYQVSFIKSFHEHLHLRVKDRTHIVFILVILSIVIFSGLNGISNSISYLFDEISQSNQMNEQSTEIASILFFVPCIVSPLVLGWIVDRTSSTLWVPLFMAISTSFCQLAFSFTQKTENFYALVTVYGFLSNAVTTVNLSIVTLLTRGKQGDFLNSLYVWFSTLWTLGFTLLFSFLSFQESMISLIATGILFSVLGFAYLLVHRRRS